MPTIKQLPAATAAGGSDLLPISQSGLTRSVTVNTLLANTQPLLSLGQYAVLGRGSAGVGGPEAIAVGSGLSIQSGTVVANGTDHTSFTLATSLLPTDEVILNSSATPKRVAASQLRSLFAAGSGIQIDSSGTISATSTSSSTGAGSAGPKGDTGAQGVAGQGFTFRGAWQANATYGAYDVVTTGGQTYVATTAILAASTFLVSAGWSLMAAQGAPGAAGATGATGPAGPTIVATASAIGAVKPGTGLTVGADGSLSVSNVALSTLAQGGATIGQLLSWSGTGWAPSSPAAGTSYTGAAPINVASGVISLAQNGAAIGQVLTWTGSAWTPQQPASTGAMVGTAVPLADGAASAGAMLTASREDHRHPTDATRAPLAAPVFTASITLPTWTTMTRPTSPTVGMEGFASDTGRRETYTASGWVQYVRISDIPAASGQLLGGSPTTGTAAAVTIGSGLSLVSGTLSAVSTNSGSSVSGVSIDGNTIVASNASPYQMAATDRVVDVNKATGAVTRVLLPTAPTLWVEYTVIDGRGDAATNNITIAAVSGVTINGQSSFVMTSNNDAISLRAVSSTIWRIT